MSQPASPGAPSAPVDPSAYAADLPQPTAADLSSLAGLVAALLAAETKRDAAQLALDEAEVAVLQLSDHDIPKLMETCGVASYTLADGTKVEVKPKLSATMPEATREQALDWLDQNGHAGLVKRTVEVAFPREDQDAADFLLELVTARFGSARMARKVEPSTLSSWAKKELEADHQLPDDLFGLFKVNRAKATPPKAKIK